MTFVGYANPTGYLARIDIFMPIETLSDLEESTITSTIELINLTTESFAVNPPSLVSKTAGIIQTQPLSLEYKANSKLDVWYPDYSTSIKGLKAKVPTSVKVELP